MIYTDFNFLLSVHNKYIPLRIFETRAKNQEHITKDARREKFQPLRRVNTQR